jgi:hypothetical protein
MQTGFPKIYSKRRLLESGSILVLESIKQIVITERRDFNACRERNLIFVTATIFLLTARMRSELFQQVFLKESHPV